MKRYLLIVFSCLMINNVSADEKHFVDDVTMAKPKEMKNVETRLTEALIQYNKYLPLKRTAFFNIAYPKDLQEYFSLQGFCVLEVIACTQNSDELPIKNLRINTESGLYKVDHIFSFLINNSRTEIVNGLGKQRGHFYFLVPYELLHENGSIIMDYNISRNDFAIAKLPLNDEHDYPAVPIPKNDETFSDKVINFMTRGFEVEVFRE